MSVINRVLVDLEKRHAHSSDARAGTPEIRAVGTEPGRGSRKALLALLIVLAIVAIATLGWQWTSTRARIQPAAPAPIAEAPVTRLPATATTPLVEAPVAAVAPTAVALADAPAPRETSTPSPRIKDPEAAPEASKPSPAAKPKSKPAAPKPGVEAASSPEPSGDNAIEKRERPLSAADRAEAQFRQAATSMQQGRMRDAEAGFLAAIAQDPGHVPSRQALLGLYLEAQRKDEAEILLRDGLKSGTRPPSWVMLLARLEADRGDLGGAVNTMQNHLDIGRQNGDYVALLAALLQKQGRHKEAAEQYQAAIGLGTPKPAWFMGQGISLRELGRREEAAAAFQRALDAGGLSSELKLFVERQIAALRLPP